MNTVTDTTANPGEETDTPTDTDTNQKMDMPTHLQKGAKKNENTVSRRILDDRRKPHQGV